MEPRKSGNRLFDVAITICILLVSVSSLIIAIVHSRTLERMADANVKLVEANSWPYLDYGTGNVGGNDGTAIELRITNDGVGPAKIESAELKWNGVAMHNALDFLRACCGYRYDKSNGLWIDLITGRVLRPGETITFITLPRSATDADAWNRLNQVRLNRSLAVDVCYCSVFDECWNEDVLQMSLTPRRVDRCTTPSVPYGAPKFQ
ncbi:MAG TPA: hypothetical protein VKR31_02775 [Rhizomicrobium sp.]|nr:hypothetical protein [Rhizomicrobium sp.]